MATLSAPPQQSVLTRLSLFLPSAVLEAYRKEAKEYGVELEEMLASRLSECVTYNATKPLYFNDKDRADLEDVLGRNVQNAQSVVSTLKRFLSVKLNGMTVTIRPTTLERLRTRAPRGMDLADWVQKKVVEWSEREAGER